MTEVGRLIQGILSVKCRGKWKRRFCCLEKQATFTNSLRFIVTKHDDGPCLLQDVVHAYLWSLDPHHPGIIMLICNYKVRCISFDHFDELNNWVDVLKTYLTCNYFHADLILASKESSLYNYARRRKRQLRQAAQSARRLNTASDQAYTAPNKFRVPSTVRDDGYLHVTRDRICYTTSPGCSKPKLLATWSFDNDDLVQCFTGRAICDQSDQGDNPVNNLFCLTASADHPEAPGGHLFISDRATELCDWIEANNQTAICQAEWRRLTSMVATLDTPFTCRMSSSFPRSVGNLGDYASLVNIDSVGGGSSYHHESISLEPQVVLENTCKNLITPGNPMAMGSFGLPKQTSLDGETASIDTQSDSSFSGMSSTVEQRTLAQEDAENPEDNIVEPSGEPSTEFTLAKVSSGMGTSSTEPECAHEVKFVFPNALAHAEFMARKRIAMHSRRRFSSQPVDTHVKHPLVGPPFCPSALLSNKGPAPSYSTASASIPGVQQDSSLSNSPNESTHFRSDQFRNRRSMCAQWRQSDPQLVTLPPFPVPLRDLNEFLHRYKCALSQSSATSPPLVHAPGDLISNQQISQGSSANSVTSSSQPAQSCPPGDAINEAPYEGVVGSTSRNRIPSSWSNATYAQNSTQWICHSLLSQRQSSGTSPQYSATPLLPTASLVPGSQHFNRRRKHTASASEAVASIGHFGSALPVRQRAVSIMDQRYTVAPESSASARLSLISLSPTSVPVWADAPVFAKPRTGHNYVSREVILASHAQRKLRHQQQGAAASVDQLPRQPPPSAGPHTSPSASHGAPSTAETLSASTVGSSAPTGQEGTRTDSCDIQNVTCTSPSIKVSQEPLNPVIPIYVESVSAQSGNADYSSRSYVNMGPTPNRRAGLQPIAESQPLPSACTDLIARLRSSTIRPSSNHSVQSVRLLPTYVNVSPPPTQPYVNMPPVVRSLNKGSGRGLHSIPSNMEQYGLKQKYSAPNLTNDGGVSTTSLFANTNTHLATNDSISSPQLHYALLTLSTATNSSSTSPSNQQPTSNSASRPSVNPSSAVEPCFLSEEQQGAVKYVTIDLVQTKALSELEQELRSSTVSSAGESLQPNRINNWSFRHGQSRSCRANSVFISVEAGRANEADTRKRPLESSRVNTTLSLPARMLTRLAQSIHLQTNSRKADSTQTPRRRFSLLTRKSSSALAHPSSKVASKLGV